MEFLNTKVLGVKSQNGLYDMDDRPYQQNADDNTLKIPKLQLCKISQILEVGQFCRYVVVSVVWARFIFSP